MLRNIRQQFLLDLGEIEGEYRASYLREDIQQSSFYILIAMISALSMIFADRTLFQDQPQLIRALTTGRAIFIVFSIVILIAIWRTSRVKVYERLMLVWLLVLLAGLLVLNWRRPPDLLTASHDIILPFAIYIISPFKILFTVPLALAFSAGSISIDFVNNTRIDSTPLPMVIISQLIVHALGLGSGLQIQSYRRKSFRALIEEKDAKEMAAYLASIDPLTKAMTRRQFFNIAEAEFQRYVRYHRKHSVLVMDADRFKDINDTYGHHAGDYVLRSLSLVVLEQKRAQDTFGRLGGEEFALLLPETNLKQAMIVAERIQKTWAQTPCVVDDHVIHSTISVGAAEVTAEDTSFDDLLRRADQMMYKAKESGRNRVVAARS